MLVTGTKGGSDWISWVLRACWASARHMVGYTLTFTHRIRHEIRGTGDKNNNNKDVYFCSGCKERKGQLCESEATRSKVGFGLECGTIRCKRTDEGYSGWLCLVFFTLFNQFFFFKLSQSRSKGSGGDFGPPSSLKQI